MKHDAWRTFVETRPKHKPLPRQIPEGAERVISPVSSVYHLRFAGASRSACGSAPTNGWALIPLASAYDPSYYPPCGRCFPGGDT